MNISPSNLRTFEPSNFSHKGSALLIVLGMLAFMVISAVGFAVFMRQSRVPSSYLRRTASSRYLLKAALANAINRIDGCHNASKGRCEGVYDDPYPGVGPSLQETVQNNGDYWMKRVFMPFGPVGHDTTVSTLTLEGLAYLPPAIINEARIYTRETRTAQWKNLAYDMGRYAFSAIDVSDCFDINKLYANERRTSAPGQRVNLSSLFPNNGAALDTLLSQWESSDIPFVSLADFNIVAGTGSAFSPFCKFISSGNNISLYRSSDAQSVSNALFITDTWFPPTNRTSSVKRIDLVGKRAFNDMNVRNFPDIDSNGNELYNVLMANLGGAGLACLYDYLDKDRKPISLALPTVETQPMVCGLSAELDECALKFEPQGAKNNTVEVTEGQKTYSVFREIKPYRLTVPNTTLSISGVAAYPFKRVHANRKGTWQVETLAAVFFAYDSLKARVAAASALRPKKEYWTNPPSPKSAGGIIWIKDKTGLSFDANVNTTDKALKTFDLHLRVPKAEFPVYCEVHEKKTEVVDPNLPQPAPAYDWTKYTTDETRESGDGGLIVYDADGELPAWHTALYNGYKQKVAIEDGDLKASYGENSQNFRNEIADATKIRPYVAVWVRITDGSDTVDMAPATCDDDMTWLQGASYNDLKDEVYKMSGGRTPLLDFRMDHEFTYTVGEANGFATLGDGQKLQCVDWKSLYAPDPRYNFAPEDWFGTTDADASKENWRQTVADKYWGKNGRDPDIFMFTSDQEYLQSMGELAFLPFVQDMTGDASFFEGDFMNGARYHGRNDFDKRSAGADSGFANGHRFWRTYTAIDHGDGVDPLYSLEDNGRRYEFVSGSSDFRVNPFSPDSRVLMAALKDTPYDWYVASTNDQGGVNPTLSMKPANRAQWAFCEQSSVAKLNDDELEDIAAEMRAEFSNYARNGNTSWEAAFSDMDWYCGNIGDEQKSLFGLDDFEQPLHGVDRKFLYSFWRECFQNRQQLFLLFIRAEPLTVGGSGANALGNAQLGARGVALVWRDPAPPTRGGRRPPRTGLSGASNWEQYYKNYAPHRTRVLFYHQFD